VMDVARVHRTACSTGNSRCFGRVGWGGTRESQPPECILLQSRAMLGNVLEPVGPGAPRVVADVGLKVEPRRGNHGRELLFLSQPPRPAEICDPAAEPLLHVLRRGTHQKKV
jgi:hypothetical protein